MDIKSIVLDLCAYDEQEWFEFKENWFQPEARWVSTFPLCPMPQLFITERKHFSSGA